MADIELCMSLTSIEEQLAHQQRDIQALSQELYAQQKEIAMLTSALRQLKQKMETSQQGADTNAPEPPPPHY